MKQLFIKDLKKGDAIFNESFAVKKYKRLATRSNKPYIDLELADNSGTINAKIWETSFSSCKEAKDGDVVTVEGTVKDFQGKIQLDISAMNILMDFDESDYVQKSKNDFEKMYQEITEYIKKIDDEKIRSLVELIIKDADFVEEFKNASAAYRVHHAYSGGLMEHIVEVLAISETLLAKFPKGNKDVVFAGAILHDLGKVFEYKIGSTINISTEGKLLGHIFIGSEYVKNKAKEISDFPKELLDEILHIILSHHGELEYGSPIKPMTVEALMVAVADRASATVNMAYTLTHEQGRTEEFTEYHRQLGTELYRSNYSNDKETLF